MTAPYGGEPPLIIDDERLSAYLDGDLSPAEREAVRRAMQSDPAIAARYRELAATVSLLHTLPTPVPRRSFTLTADQLRDVSPIPAVPIPMPRLAATPPLPASSTTVTPLHSVPRVARLTPLFGAFGAIAAVLLLMLVSADFATGGFKATSSRANSARIEQVTTAPPALPVPSAQSALPASGGASAAQAAPRSSNAITAAATTTTSGATVAASPTSVRTTSATNQPATITTTSTGLPLALIRAVEVALGIIAIAGIVAAIQNSRGRGHAAVYR